MLKLRYFYRRAILCLTLSTMAVGLAVLTFKFWNFQDAEAARTQRVVWQYGFVGLVSGIVALLCIVAVSMIIGASLDQSHRNRERCRRGRKPLSAYSPRPSMPPPKAEMRVHNLRPHGPASVGGGV